MSMHKRLLAIIDRIKAEPREDDDLAPDRAIIWYIIGIGLVIVATSVIWRIFN